MKQRFKSKKSNAFIAILAVVTVLLLFSFLANFSNEDADRRTWEYIGNLLFLLLPIYYIFILVFSYIELDDKVLTLRTGFSVKRIEIATIRALKTKSKKSLMYGSATQLTIQYNKYDEIIFYPEDITACKNAILDKKPDIMVSED